MKKDIKAYFTILDIKSIAIDKLDAIATAILTVCTFCCSGQMELLGGG